MPVRRSSWRSGYLELLSLNTFQALVALQEKDKVLHELQDSQKQIQNELERKASQLKLLRADRDVARRAHIEAELKLNRIKLDRAEQNQALVTTRDMYYSGEHTMSSRVSVGLEQNITEIENRIARMDDDIVPAQEIANDARAKLNGLEARLSEVEAEWAEKKESGIREWQRIVDEHGEKLKERMAAAAEIPPHQLAEYTRLINANRRSNRREAVATVEREVCSGCSERLSAGKLNALRQATEPELCDCGRFLITLNTR